MATLLLRNIRSGKRAAMIVNTDKITARELKSELDPIRKALILQFKKIVSNWKSDVDFSGRSIISGKGLAVNVFPTGNDKNIWDYVDQGTRSHTITAVNSPTLKFQTKYTAKTAAKPARVVVSGGAGKSSGDWVSPISVIHPGIEAREFTKVIGDDSIDFFRRRVEAAFKRAQRQINKQ